MSVENNTATEGITVKLVRGSTDLSQWGQWMGYTRTYMNAHPSLHLDSPATTSATTYKVQFKEVGKWDSLHWNFNSSSSMTLWR